jgi:hypothetical protein
VLTPPTAASADFAEAATATPHRGGPTPPAAGRALLERGARFVVLGLVAMIVLSTAAALLGFDGGPAIVTADHGPGGIPGPAAGAPTPQQVPAITVGPYPGDSVTTYAGIADQELAQYAQSAPQADLLAIVSLSSYRTPAALHLLFAEYRITEVFYAVPGTGGPTHTAAVTDPIADVLAAFQAQADADTRQAADASDPTTRARAAGEARGLRADCACLFAAVVRAPAAELELLRHDPSVRVVDPAPPGTFEAGVTFVPILPSQT